MEAPARMEANETHEFADGIPAATLFPNPNPPAGQKVIPFDRLQRASGASQQPFVSPAAAKPARGAVRSALFTGMQETLNFVPAAPAQARKLKTDVESQVFCEQPVAALTHRFVAASIDALLILIGFALFLATLRGFGGGFGSGRIFWMSAGSAFVLIALLYGFIWSVAGTETPGMRATGLRLITFDGFPVDPRSRALRFISIWLSFCSGGLGVLWALADEENLTWHDHISNTFPTIMEAGGTFVKQGR